MDTPDTPGMMSHYLAMDCAAMHKVSIVQGLLESRSDKIVRAKNTELARQVTVEGFRIEV
ncbi:hypothetical protein RO3G_13350 [Rhizopus delemar RA 99-880]|uniref:Uncharacterized protein n=1 Tax=Rhizopus delemar (strain RA 99-880 / ATCC MYA-4621 / FGSC 9543 / NRRL 43880) TaxID=246409 RepID=I1CJK9_RHIO9|nr:hypothetical protein RO3G_13350 [Rhizopus delemar RA 99-880]|eukprot:EIE88639.1 hypothetical protein RO3G_13350 [Rhizopus delemar RA 99-880]